jgi:hypothetical protein
MDDLPIACTLSAGDMTRRVASSAAITSAWMLDSEITPRGASLRFDRAAESDLRALIAAESECCAFMEFGLRPEGADLRLTVEGPDGARPIILDLFGLGPAHV